MWNTRLVQQVDLRNVGKGLFVGLSMLYGANRATDAALDQFDKRIEEVKRDMREHDAEVGARVARELDILRAEIRELRDHEARRAHHEG